MKNTQFNIGDVIAKNPSALSINQEIKKVLNNDELWAEMEPYLIDPGVTGSKQFDQMRAVDCLLKHDKLKDGVINRSMDQIASLNEKAIWSRMQSVLKQVGFDMHHGRISGTHLEHKKDEATEIQEAVAA